MDFKLTDEQRMLEETISRLIRDAYTFETRERSRRSAQGFSTEFWRQFADLGLLGLPFSSDYGGFDGGGVELMLVSQGFGRGLVLEPWLTSVVLCGILIDRLGSAQQKEYWLSRIAAGESRPALAAYEPQGVYDHGDVLTTARLENDSYILDGHKAVVWHGDSADQLLVTANTGNGLSAFIIDANAEGVERQGYPTVDGLRAAEIHLNAVKVPREALLGQEGQALAALQAAIDHGIVALCGEAVGAMQIACEQTLAYIKEREQFGVPIGRFQALQHRMVDMYMALEKARSMSMLAACSLNAPAESKAKRLAAAKLMIGKTGRYVAEEAIQLYGGMGMMEETAISHYAKRLVMIDHQLGDLSYHLQRLEALVEVEDEMG